MTFPPPAAGDGRRLVVEADGGSRGNPGPAAYGAVVRDAQTGAVLAEVAEHIGRATNNVAEYRGLIAGLEAARALDPEARVEARLDSKLVVEQMSGRWKVKHPDMRPLALAAQRILPPQQVTFTWVPRERNRDADRLANEALDAAARGQVWVPREVVLDESEPAPALPGTREAPGPPTTLLLARHGATAHTLAKVFSGHGGADPGLVEDGRRQAERLATLLAGRGGIDAIVSSPARRARETADVLAGGLGLPVRTDDGFRECDFGAWEGATFAEVSERWPQELTAWLASTAVAPPGGESFDAVAARVATARDRVIARYPARTVLVVTHVTPVKTLVRLALGAPPAAIFRMELEPTSVSELHWYPDGNASLHRFNDTGHLR